VPLVPLVLPVVLVLVLKFPRSKSSAIKEHQLPNKLRLVPMVTPRLVVVFNVQVVVMLMLGLFPTSILPPRMERATNWSMDGPDNAALPQPQLLLSAVLPAQVALTTLVLMVVMVLTVVEVVMLPTLPLLLLLLNNAPVLKI